MCLNESSKLKNMHNSPTDLLGHIDVVLDVDDEDVVSRRWHGGGDGTDEAVVERRQKGVRADVAQAHCDAVEEHVCGDETHEETRRRRQLVDAVCGAEKRNTSY